ncbi:thioredoxin [Anthocerotibacter panamensis]|uniref:thioredoxin n=1 Tax=Anthocerotibacter panamensis TaxID=2857077 RepID=UPI001C403D1B|nr:thioredoxin [Anthocerotibacter panamensis]
MSTVPQVQSPNFDEFLAYEGPVVVDFTATWCGPCRMISPLIDQLAQEYEGRARVAKLDVDESPDTARKFEIKSIPAVLVFKDGALVERIIGAVPYEKFSSALERHL